MKEGKYQVFSDLILEKGESIYKQIERYIKNMIMSGLLPSGSKLPSTRELALMLKVSRNTIMRVYDDLEDAEYIYTIKDKGTFIKSIKSESNSNWKVNWLEKVNRYAEQAEKLDIVKHEAIYKEGMISFKSISPDESIFNLEELKRAFLNRVSVEGGKILNYGYARGYKPLIEYLKSYLQTKGIDIYNKELLITNGFTEGFDIVLSCITEKGDKIICENPTHNTAIKIMKLHELDIIGIDMQNDGMNIGKLEEKLEKNNVKLAYIIPSYHNPTGIVMTSEKREEVFKLFNKYDVPIIEDGFNEELLYGSSHIAPIAALCGKGNGVIYLGSFSKILFPGLRIGWILADREIIDIFESVKRSRNIHTSFLDQAVFYEYLQEGSFGKFIKKAKRSYRKKFKTAYDLADRYIPHQYILGDGGLHIFIKLGNVNAREVLKECISKGVIFLPGDVFYVDDSGNDTIRLGFSKVTEEQIEKGFKIIGKAVEKCKTESLEP